MSLVEGTRAARASRRARRLQLDPIRCDGYGVCAELLPEIIDLDEWGYPVLTGEGEVPPSLEGHARRAVRTCPKLALRLTIS